MLAAIEAGGTKFVCAVGPDPRTVLRLQSIPTRGPRETLAEVGAFLAAAGDELGAIASLGIGSFGPLDLDPASASYGAITATPKPGWSGVNMRTQLAAVLRCPVAIDTDVNASGLAEAAIGAGRGVASTAYVTVGTGLGGGLIVGGRPLHGLGHPEMGHIPVRRHAQDSFAGSCPFHGDCLEGLAAGSAIHARIGCHLDQAAPTDPVWTIVADYLGQLCATLVLMAAPNRIVLGGGVMASNPALFGPVRQAAQRWLGGYVHTLADAAAFDALVVPPVLGPQAGIVGALMMAEAGPRAT